MKGVSMMATTFDHGSSATERVTPANAEFDRTFPVGGASRFVLENPCGSVVVRAWDRPEIQVRASRRRGRSPERFEATRVESNHQDNVVMVRTVLDPAAQFEERGVLSGVAAEIVRAFGDLVRSAGKPCDVDYAVMVPTGCGVELKCVSSSIAMDGIVGSIAASSVSGDVVVDRVEGDVRLQTVSGDIRARSVHGQTYVESVSGEVTVDGRVTSLAAKTVSGAIEISSSLEPTASYELRTVSGDATLRIPAQSAASIGVRGVSCDVESDLPCVVTRDSRWPGAREWQGTLNGGGARIQLQTVSGSLRLRELRPAPGVGAAPSPTPPVSIEGSAFSPTSDVAAVSDNEERAQEPPSDEKPAPEANTASVDQPAPQPESVNDDDSAMSVLQALERGELNVDEALRRLDGLRGTTK